MARKLPAQPEVNIGLVGHVDHGKTTLDTSGSLAFGPTPTPKNESEAFPSNSDMPIRRSIKDDNGQFYATGKRPDGGKDVEKELKRGFVR